MSDILIKNMMMPTDDILRIEICPNGQVNRIIGWAISEQNRGTAIELPPHGRLVDADKFDLKFITFRKMEDGKEIVTYDAPTVLEATNE